MLLKTKLIYKNIYKRVVIFERTKITKTYRHRALVGCLGCALYDEEEPRGCSLRQFGIDIEKLLCGFDIFNMYTKKVQYKYVAKEIGNN